MLVHDATLNLGLIMRKHFGFGTPRGMQGLPAAQATLTGRIRTALLLVLRRLQRRLPGLGQEPVHAAETPS